MTPRVEDGTDKESDAMAVEKTTIVNARNEEARLAAGIRRRAVEVGFDLVGITTAEPTTHGPRYGAWLDHGHHGAMGYLAREDAAARRLDLSGTLDRVRSVVVVGHEYGNGGTPEESDPSRGIIARYARGRDYHRIIVPRMKELHAWIEEDLGRPVPARAYADTGPILERDLAQRAGLGWFGRNTMIINPRKGSYFLLGVLLLDLDLEPDPPFEPDHCGSCRACLDACPTGALLGRNSEGAPVMDARLCISYLTIELRGPIPIELRPLIGNRVFGCDICQEVCPFNQKFAGPATEPGYAARPSGQPPFGVQPLPSDSGHPGTASPSLVELLETALDESVWESFSRGSAIRRAGRAGFARNVCVGLGNWGAPEAVPVLTAALRDPEPLVRAHAAWALGRVGSADAVAAVRRRALVESDDLVADELREALGR